MIRGVYAGVLLAGLVLAGLFGATSASADVPTPVPAHRHYILVNDEKVYMGPNFCDVGGNAIGFAQFHRQVHLTDPGLIDVKSESCATN